MKRFISLIIFLICTVSAYSAESGGFNYNAVLKQELNKLVVLPEDQMELESFAYSIKTIRFKKISIMTYNIQGLKQTNNEEGLNRLRILFASGGDKAHAHYTRFLTFWKSAWDNRSREDTQSAVSELRLAALALNAAIVTGAAARERVTLAYRELMRPEIEKKLMESDRQQQQANQEMAETAHYQDTLGNKKMLFIGGFYNLYLRGMGGGFKLGGYFSDAMTWFNFGVFLNVLYFKKDFEITTSWPSYKEYRFKSYYYGLEILFSMKLNLFSYKHTLHYNIGLVVLLKDGGEEYFTYPEGTVKMNKTSIGICGEIGYLFLFGKHNYGLNISMIYQVMFSKAVEQKISDSYKSLNYFFGVRIGFLFNLK